MKLDSKTPKSDYFQRMIMQLAISFRENKDSTADNFRIRLNEDLYGLRLLEREYYEAKAMHKRAVDDAHEARRTDNLERNAHIQDLTETCAALREDIAGLLRQKDAVSALQENDAECSSQFENERDALKNANSCLKNELGTASYELEEIAEYLRGQEINQTAAMLERKAQRFRATIAALTLPADQPKQEGETK